MNKKNLFHLIVVDLIPKNHLNNEKKVKSTNNNIKKVIKILNKEDPLHIIMMILVVILPHLLQNHRKNNKEKDLYHRPLMFQDKINIKKIVRTEINNRIKKNKIQMLMETKKMLKLILVEIKNKK